MSLRLLVAGQTDTGLQREQNEDHFDKKILGDSQSSGIFVVSDGMGGYHAGEVASEIAVETMMDALTPVLDPTAVTVRLAPKDVKRKKPRSGKKDAAIAESTTSASSAVVSGAEDSGAEDYNPLETRVLSETVGMDHYVGKLKEAVRAANDAIVAYGESHKEARGLGATVTAAIIVNGQAFIANVGDSRTYLIRDGAIKRITRDHSLVQRLVEMEQITADEVYEHPSRNLIYRSLGAGHTEVDVDVFHINDLKPSDTLLLCCDGLWEMVRDPDLLRIISESDDLDKAAKLLIDTANEHGGEDNITAVLVRCVEA